MLINGKHFITVWTEKNSPDVINTIDQRLLPHKFNIVKLRSSEQIANAIKTMLVRGAPLIGVIAAYGIYLAALEAYRKKLHGSRFDDYVFKKAKLIISTRPTAVNLSFAVNNSLELIKNERTAEEKTEKAFLYAKYLSGSEIESCRRIGIYGLELIRKMYRKKRNKTVNILTHCKAGWLACIDYGTATAPVYFAAKEKIKLHIWVEETRPRNQGAGLTAFELMHNNIDCTVITDNAGGYVMQKGMVDMVLVGSDRTTLNGDVCNKVGTYKTALAAFENKIPFYAALPVTTFDFSMKDGLKEIPIEERDAGEVDYIQVLYKNKTVKVRVTPKKCKSRNFSFDITPARYITSLITDRGIKKPDANSIKELIC